MRQPGSRGTVPAMPLRCLDEHGASLHAFALPPLDWAALTADNRLRRHLRMACCDARISLKRSALGLQFFAHVVRGGCLTGDESPDHLALKQLAVDAARRHGWDAETEVAGDGWRADVLATRGRMRVAIEVQWSSQNDGETLRRQAQYAAAGVRGLWLFRQRSFPASAEVPALRVAGSAQRGYTVLGVDVAVAFDAAFARRLSFGFPLGAIAAARIVAGVAECWGRDCGALTRIVARIELRHGASQCSIDVKDLPLGSASTRALIAALPIGDMLGHVRPRRDAKDGMAMTNGCFRCDRLLDSRRAVAATQHHLTTFDMPMDADLARVLAVHPSATLAWGIVDRVAPPHGVG